MTTALGWLPKAGGDLRRIQQQAKGGALLTPPTMGPCSAASTIHGGEGSASVSEERSHQLLLNWLS